MKASQIISTFAMILAISCAIALISLDLEWACRTAGGWIILYYFYLILDEHENKE